MLERSLERIKDRLAADLVNALRRATIDELAELLPAVRRLVDDGKHAERKTRPAPAKADRSSIEAAIVRILAKNTAALRSEELQHATGVDASSMRAALQELVASGKIDRTGQARGTRYSVATVRREAPAVEEPTVDEINRVRQHLVAAAAPSSAAEIQASCELSPVRARATIAKLVALGFVAREGHGGGTRYRLAAQSAPGGSKSGAPRVVRRPPRAKTWSTLREDDAAKEPPAPPAT